MLNVDIESLVELQQGLADSSEELGKLLDVLDADLSILERSWDGAAAAAFTTARTQFDVRARAVKAALASIAKVASDAAEAYTRVEQNNIVTWT